jgi:hypothetical protein
MMETNVPEITSEEIMEKIREEVRRRRPQEPKGSSNLLSQSAEAVRLPRFSGDGRIPEKRVYHVRDFLPFYDKSFVKNAYRALLKREADPEGLDAHLSRLQNARLTKIGVLGHIRYSGEGRSKGVRIKGLLVPFVLDYMGRIPLLGYCFRVVHALVRLPLILRDIQEFENSTSACFSRTFQHVDTLAGKVEVQQLREALQQFREALDEKAEANCVEWLREALAHKAEVSSVEELRETMTGKADKKVAES